MISLLISKQYAIKFLYERVYCLSYFRDAFVIELIVLRALVAQQRLSSIFNSSCKKRKWTSNKRVSLSKSNTKAFFFVCLAKSSSLRVKKNQWLKGLNSNFEILHIPKIYSISIFHIVLASLMPYFFELVVTVGCISF